MSSAVLIDGICDPAFTAVREALAQNLAEGMKLAKLFPLRSTERRSSICGVDTRTGRGPIRGSGIPSSACSRSENQSPFSPF
jgi:hypothetical protein